MKQRDNILDTAKFILILFVVLGHVIPKLGGGKLLSINELRLFVSYATVRNYLWLLDKTATS